MNIKELTKQLIQIPSYVDERINEKEVSDFIFAYLQEQSDLIVEKEFVEEDRYNIIAYSPSCKNSDDSFAVDTLFINHIDTVEPKQGGKYGQFKGVEENGKLYGLGSADTKGNVAVLMKVAELISNQKYMFLFYIDEEYHFKGIKKFRDNFKSRLEVKRIISADGENLQIRNASRGVVAIDIICIGKTGHAANAANGVNVVIAFNRICTALENTLIKEKDFRLGRSSLNIAYVRAGLQLGTKDQTIVLGKNGNNIPDYLEATLEFRLNSKTTLRSILDTLQQLARDERIELKTKPSQNNLKPWFTPRNRLDFIENALRDNGLKVSYTDPGNTGYVDIGLLQEVFPSICFCIGATGKNRHGTNEYVEIASLYKLYAVFKSLIEI